YPEVGAWRHARRPRRRPGSRRQHDARRGRLAYHARARRAALSPRARPPAAQRRAAGRLRARVSGASLRGQAAESRRPLPQAGSAVRALTAALEGPRRAAVGRHLRVYLKNWHTSFLPPVLEPITLLLAFGLGLGAYMSSGIEGDGRSIGYINFVAPGMLAYATFMTAIFQSLFGAFIRMRYQRTWEGQLTTQIELRHVVWGEILWAGLL